jgi:membrane-bound serine protease (ClpP class)
LEQVALVLLICGALFLLAEFFIPGFGFFGVSGILLVVVSAVMTIMYVRFGLFIVIAEVAVLVLLGYLAVEYFGKHNESNRVILNETLNEDVSKAEQLRSYIGREAVTRTPLKPFGNIDIDGVYVEVCSDGDFIGAGERVLVVREYESKLYVRKIN